MSKPILCFDFDGTLVDEHGHVHPNDIDILRNEDRVIFIPATGRPLHAVRHAFQRNGLFSDKPISFPMVLQNGAVIYHPNEVLQQQTPFPVDEQTKLLEISQRHSQVCCLLFSVNQVEIMWPNPVAQRMVRRFDLDVQQFQRQSNLYTKFVYIADAATAMAEFLTEIEAIPVEKSFSLPTVLELTKIGIDKGQMLVKLLDNLGLHDAQVIAAGDGENDLSLFDVADMSFCPNNSPAAIKACANTEIDITETGLLAPMLAEIGLRGMW